MGSFLLGLQIASPFSSCRLLAVGLLLLVVFRLKASPVPRFTRTVPLLNSVIGVALAAALCTTVLLSFPPPPPSPHAQAYFKRPPVTHREHGVC